MLYLSDFHQYIIFLLLYSLNASNYLIFILVYNKILSTNATFRVNAYFEPQFSEYLILGIFEIVKYFDLVKLTLLTKNFTKSRFDCIITSISIKLEFEEPSLEKMMKARDRRYSYLIL